MKTVKELIELLKKEDPERIVVMSKDAEGNNFSPFSDLGLGCYKPNSTWAGELYDEEDVDEDDYKEGGKHALVLWPTN